MTLSDFHSLLQSAGMATRPCGSSLLTIAFSPILADTTKTYSFTKYKAFTTVPIKW